MVKIQMEPCTGCGACVKDCPAYNLRLENGKAQVRGRCIQCGHCVAICPTGAAEIPDYNEVPQAWNPDGPVLDPKALFRAIKFRRSIRNYLPRNVEPEQLELILQAGRYTATAKNTQGCRFIVVQRELETFKKMIWSGLGEAIAAGDQDAELYKTFYDHYRENPENDYLFRNAPAVLFVAARATLDAGLAAQNMELAAVAQGLGMLYNGYLVRAAAVLPGVSDWLGAGDKPLAACMLLGYPDVSYRRSAPRREIDLIMR